MSAGAGGLGTLEAAPAVDAAGRAAACVAAAGGVAAARAVVTGELGGATPVTVGTATPGWAALTAAAAAPTAF